MTRKYDIRPKWDGQTYVLKACAHCGRPFSYYRDKARYCSGACRVAALRDRRRQEPGGPTQRATSSST